MGSPPRVRGKAKGQVLAALAVGITPACAGKSICRRARRSAAWDHPRVCGEKIILRKYAPGCAGSPPRVRGKAPMPGAQDAGRRITPACAGKSSSGSSAYCVHRDHPRVCGEKLCVLFLYDPEIGSPPRVRGKGRQSHRAGGQRGITPACAGKRWGTLRDFPAL